MMAKTAVGLVLEELGVPWRSLVVSSFGWLLREHVSIWIFAGLTAGTSSSSSAPRSSRSSLGKLISIFVGTWLVLIWLRNDYGESHYVGPLSSKHQVRS
jgi:hypothetical protein